MSDNVREEPATAGSRDPEVRRLDPKAVVLWRLTGAVRSAAAVTVALVVELSLDLPVPTGSLAVAVAITALAFVIVAPPLRYQRWSIRLDDEHLRLRHGVLFRTTSIVPYARVQHVDTRHGPVDRWLGLASLVVFTAGTQGATLTIPGLDHDEAERVRDRLAALSGAGDAV